MNTTSRQIIVLGGGGFLMEPHNPLLDEYILQQSNAQKPKICFIGTAGGDSNEQLVKFQNSFAKYNCEPSSLSLFKPHTPQIEDFVLGQDIIYVGGGNTRNLITLWKNWGLDQILKKAYQKGIVLSGISAGMICWFEQGLTDSNLGTLSALTCLGWLEGSACPHFDGEKDRRPRFLELIKSGELKNGWACDDGAAIHFINEKFHKAVCSHPEKRVYRVENKNGATFEEAIPTNYLGGRSIFVRRAAINDARAIHDAHMRSIQTVCANDYTTEEIKAWGYRPYSEEQRVSDIKNTTVWVVEDRGEIRGFGKYSTHKKADKTVGYLNALYFTKEVVGKGFGKAIVGLAIEEAKKDKATRIDTESTITALSFYKAAGFRETGPQATMVINGLAIRCHPMSLSLEFADNIKIRLEDPGSFSAAQKFYQSVGYTHPIQPSDIVISASRDSELVGIVRLAIEEGFMVLRGMQVIPELQFKGVGSRMLKKLVKYIGRHDCYCLPHGWLETFYGQIGFSKIADSEAPPHLLERLVENRKKYPQLIVMKRSHDA